MQRYRCQQGEVTDRVSFNVLMEVSGYEELM